MSSWQQPSLSSMFNTSFSTPVTDFTYNTVRNLQQYDTNSRSANPSLRDVSLSFNYEEMIHGHQGRSFGPSLSERRIEEPLYYENQLSSLKEQQVINRQSGSQKNFSGRWMFKTPGVSASNDTYFPRNLNPTQCQKSQNNDTDPIASMLHERQQKVKGIPSLRSLFVPESSSKDNIGLTQQMHLISTICERDQRNGYRLKRLLGLPFAKELWLETTTGRFSFDGGQIINRLEENRTYYYNISTLRVSFEMPSPLSAIIRQQAEIRKMLDMTTPCTIIVTRCYPQLTEELLRKYFEQYGEIAFAKVFSVKTGGTINSTKKNRKKKLAYLRMDSVQIQKKLLEQMSFTIEGHNVELRIPSNRVFISRVPDEAQPNELIQFIGDEIKKFDPRGYCVDVYFPNPFRQFAFCTVGGTKVSARLAIKADFFFKDSSINISTCCDVSELDADRLLEQKIKELVEHSDYARIRSLQNISTEVKSMIQILAKMKKFANEMTLLMVINTEFLKSSEEKLRNYLYVQDNVLEMCKKVALESNNESHNLKRKRNCPESDQTLVLPSGNLSNDEEDIELDDESQDGDNLNYEQIARII